MKLLNINKNSTNLSAILILPEKATLNLPKLISNYITPLNEFKDRVLVVGVFTPEKGAIKKSIADAELEEVLELAETYGITDIFVANADYYKFLTKAKKRPAFEREIGSVREVNGFNIYPVLNYQVLAFQASKRKLMDKSIEIMKAVLGGTYNNDTDFVDSLDIKLYTDFDEAYKALKELSKYDMLAVDIETTGLDWVNDRLITISFSPNETSGISIALCEEYSSDYKKNLNLIKKFFEQYKGKVIGHNFSFDMKFIVKLWLSNVDDYKTIVDTINLFDIDDTMVMSAICLNNVDKASYKLKDLAYEKYGNWDGDIDQSVLLTYPFEKTGKYNTIDTMATFYLYNKFSERMVEENLTDFYFNVERPLVKSVLKMQMAGLAFDKDKMVELQTQLEEFYNEQIEILNSTNAVQEVTRILKEEYVEKKNKTLKTKQITIDDVNISFNPKSSKQVRLLFQIMGLQIDKKTDSGEISTGKMVIQEQLEVVDKDSENYKILKALEEIAFIKTLKSTFLDGLIPKLVEGSDGVHRVYGNLNQTGTISFRLSSNNPNLLNMPSTGSKYAKPFKNTMIAEPNKVVLGYDYSSLETVILANKSRDKATLDTLTRGINGHNINSWNYWSEQMPIVTEKMKLLNKPGKFYYKPDGEHYMTYHSSEIDELTDEYIEISKDEFEVKTINMVAFLYKDLRQKSKAVSFGCSYGAGAAKIQEYLKCSKQEAEAIFNRYWTLYSGVREYYDKVEEQLIEKGYVDLAFGGKLYATLPEDKAKRGSVIRSVSNATIQSFALLTANALNKIYKEIEDKGLTEHIKPIAFIYDSLEFQVTKAPEILKIANDIIIKHMTWVYDENWAVPVEAEGELGLHNWNFDRVLPIGATKEEIQEILDELEKEKADE